MNLSSRFTGTIDQSSVANQRADDRSTNAPAFQRSGGSRMRTGSVDRVSSLLMALIVLFGSVVAMMFVAWMIMPPQQVDRTQTALITSVIYGSSQKAELDFEEPAAAEVESLADPTLAETVQQVTEVPNEWVAPPATRGSGDFGDGEGQGAASSGQLVAGPPHEVVPEYLRWELNFKASSEKEFAKQMEALNIELGAFGGGVQGIDYAGAPFSKSTIRRSNDPTAEKRLYFSWNRPTPLQAYERALIERAGIVAAGRHLVKFIAPELEKSLAEKELEYAQKRGVTSVAAISKTIFECRPADGGYDFVLIDQRYRNLP